MSANPAHSDLETFPNPAPAREYEIVIEAPEFTCVCPKTGHPDFATLKLTYTPDKLCLELKAWKLYIHSWRNVGIFHEAVTNRIADDLIRALKPRKLSLTGAFHAHGGITTSVTVDFLPKKAAR
ncbi:MAG: NADPH-dependent 7-cyano-7-deazaguanine reductase QueF [Planctomycetes bacterium]|nr:NADPH-dependent 7-cyano-7-deazaguanine reductase QueF [Planctomycetota bacterium]